MKFKRRWGKKWKRVERKTPFAEDELTCTTNPTSGSGCVGEREGRGESSWGGCVVRCDPRLSESKEVKRLLCNKARDEVSLAGS